MKPFKLIIFIVLAAYQISASAGIAEDRSNAAAFAKVAAAEYEDAMANGSLADWFWSSVKGDRENAACRAKCVNLKVVFTDFDLSPTIDNCTIALSWAKWHRWEEMLDGENKSDGQFMEDGENNPTDHDPWYKKIYSKPFKWLSETLDFKADIQQSKAAGSRLRTFIALMSRDCK